MIHETNSYHIFKRQHANRPINDFHVNKLVESMSKHGFLSAYHIIVNTSMEVIDGQHRLEAAKISGLPVHYAVQENVDFELNRELNSLNRKWRMEDYLESFATDGYAEYIKIKNYMQEHGLTLSSILTVAMRENSKVRRNDFNNNYKTGFFVFPTSKKSSSAFEIIKAVKKKHVFANTRYFAHASHNLSYLNGFDLVTMLSRIETYPSKITKCHDTQSYLEMLVGVYNYNTKKNTNRIRID